MPDGVEDEDRFRMKLVAEFYDLERYYGFGGSKRFKLQAPNGKRQKEAEHKSRTQKSKKTGLDERRQLENIYNKHINIVKSMINGLEKMKLTYRSSEEVVEQIDKIINSLNYVNV